jgi:hypothetical protein
MKWYYQAGLLTSPPDPLSCEERGRNFERGLRPLSAGLLPVEKCKKYR